jgi:hypothetical protein
MNSPAASVWWIKILKINAIAFVILLSSYHVCVRFTWVGAWLNGRRALPKAPLKKDCPSKTN